MEIYKPIKSTRKTKKMMVLTKKGIIHFGDSSMEDYTQHKDEKRRINYCKRSAGIKDGNGNLTKNNKESSNYFSRKYLWNC
tara:strand:+ start:1087 stop:1329 length:243 start_codon:yes stop_codon:yes gene_type:complete